MRRSVLVYLNHTTQCIGEQPSHLVIVVRRTLFRANAAGQTMTCTVPRRVIDMQGSAQIVGR